MTQQKRKDESRPDKQGKSGGKRTGTVTPDPAQTRKTGPSGLHNITAEPETTD